MTNKKPNPWTTPYHAYFRFHGKDEHTLVMSQMEVCPPGPCSHPGGKYAEWTDTEYAATPSWPSSPTEWECTLVSEGDQLTVVARLLGEVWMLGVSPVDEHTLIPDWRIWLKPSPDTKASPLLEVQAPIGTKVIHVYPPPRSDS